MNRTEAGELLLDEVPRGGRAGPGAQHSQSVLCLSAGAAIRRCRGVAAMSVFSHPDFDHDGKLTVACHALTTVLGLPEDVDLVLQELRGIIGPVGPHEHCDALIDQGHA